MSFDENTQTISVGSRDWMEASKNMEVRGYLSPLDAVEIAGEQVEQNTPPTVTAYEIPTPTAEELAASDQHSEEVV